MSIGKVQAIALADGFIDDVAGSDDGYRLEPRETISEIFLLAGELIDTAQDNLNSDKSNASGGLSESIAAREPVTGPGFLQIDIEMNAYGQLINSGVRGTKGGSGLYAFKNDKPGEKMVKSFMKYMTDARSKIGSVKRPLGYESKNAEIAKRQSAYAMARATKQKGIKATHFMDKAIDATDKKVSERLGDALAIDVLNSLPDKL